MKKYIIALLLLFLIAPFSFSEDYDFTSLTWKGTINLELDKDTFKESENITGTLTVINAENYPMTEIAIILQVGIGTYEYPSQFANKDNIIHEEIIKIQDWVLPNSKKTFSFQIPTQKSGDYRIDAYSTVGKAKFIGANWIFLSPLSKNFSVEGEKGDEQAKIYREITKFNGKVGPVGFPAEAGSEIKGSVYVQNPTDKEKSGLELGIRICEWGAQFCKDEIEKKFIVPSIKPNEIKEIIVSTVAPLIPSAYEINIVLYNNEKEIQSIYKNRVIVSGGTAKIRKVMLTGLENRDPQMDILISASPDHFNMPTFENFKIKMKLFENDSLKSEKEIMVEKIVFEEIQKHTFNTENNEFDKVCFAVEKEEIVYDEMCFNFSMNALQSNYFEVFPEIVKVDWVYNEALENLNIKFTKNTPMYVEAKLSINQNTTYKEEIKDVTFFEKNIFQKKENLILIIDDLDAKNQQVIHINLKVDSSFEGKEVTNEMPQDSVEICSGIVCQEGSVCTSQPTLVNGQACCLSECINQEIKIENENILGIPLIFWIAIIMLIIAVTVGYSALKKVKKK